MFVLPTVLPLFLFRFDAVIISSEVGYEKPDSKIFEAALGMHNGSGFSPF